MQHEAFTSGNFDTHFVKKYFTPEVLQHSNDDEALIAAIVMERLLGGKNIGTHHIASENGQISNWIKNRKKIT